MQNNNMYVYIYFFNRSSECIQRETKPRVYIYNIRYKGGYRDSSSDKIPTLFILNRTIIKPHVYTGQICAQTFNIIIIGGGV